MSIFSILYHLCAFKFIAFTLVFFLSFVNYRDFQISFNLKAILYLAKIALKLPWLSAVKTSFCFVWNHSFIFQILRLLRIRPQTWKQVDTDHVTEGFLRQENEIGAKMQQYFFLWLRQEKFSLAAGNIHYVRTWLRYKTLYSQSNKTRHLKRTPPLLFPTITPLNHPL